MKGPRGITKEVTVEKSRTVVYHFTADDIRKRLKLPEGTSMTAETQADNGEIIALVATVKE